MLLFGGQPGLAELLEAETASTTHSCCAETPAGTRDSFAASVARVTAEPRLLPLAMVGTISGLN